MNNDGFRWVLPLLLVLTFTSAPLARAQVDAEPNSTCASAQDLPAPAPGSPLTISGSLDSPPTTPDIDFYRITLSPGTPLRVRLQGESSEQGTLADPLLGAYDGDCVTLLASNNDNNEYTENGELDRDSLLDLTVPASGVLVLAATSHADHTFKGRGEHAGTYRLVIEDVGPARSITGRVVVAETGAPVPNTLVVLSRCWDTLCWDAYPIGETFTGPQGEFLFENGVFSGYSFLHPGSYLVTVPLPTSERPHRIFTLSSGQEMDLGAIGVGPLLPTGWIRGRLVDAVTREPLPGLTEPFARVRLVRCDADLECSVISDVIPEPDGAFRLQENPAARLFPGTYRLWTSARQYQTTLSEPIQVQSLERLEIGDFAMKSFPVRIYVDQSCSEIPDTGGDCDFRMRVINGSPGRFSGDVWSMVSGYHPLDESVRSASFQAGPAQKVSLAPGASVIVSFSISVAAHVSHGYQICAEGFAAQRPHSFNTVGRNSLFCLYKGIPEQVLVPEVAQ